MTKLIILKGSSINYYRIVMYSFDIGSCTTLLLQGGLNVKMLQH